MSPLLGSTEIQASLLRARPTLPLAGFPKLFVNQVAAVPACTATPVAPRPVHVTPQLSERSTRKCAFSKLASIAPSRVLKIMYAFPFGATAIRVARLLKAGSPAGTAVTVTPKSGERSTLERAGAAAVLSQGEYTRLKHGLAGVLSTSR